MSDASDTTAVRQLFALAINDMEKSSFKCSMDKQYDFFCLEVVRHHLSLFYGNDKEKLEEGCYKVRDNYQRAERRKREYEPSLKLNNAPEKMMEYIIRMFAGGYNTLYESATSWLEPTEKTLEDVLDSLSDEGIDIAEDVFLQIFNAWIIDICDRHTALGQTISDDVRQEVRRVYDGYGIKKNWSFPDKILTAMGHSKECDTINIWTDIFNRVFLDSNQDTGRLYVDLSRIRPRFAPSHLWYRCEKCSEITPYPLKDCCPMCYQQSLKEMTEHDYLSLAFWRSPIDEAIKGNMITVIYTEEHTAQRKKRAALSLAEALRLAVSKELDIEFSELIAGYRIRENEGGKYIDIFLYDALSSGAGYSVSLADNIETLLQKTEEILACDCDTACHKCLKHYGNQQVHGSLDRAAAMELLQWGRKGQIASDISINKQISLFSVCLSIPQST